MGDQRSSSLAHRLRNEIMPLLEELILRGEVRFDNPHLIDCREALDCTQEECPYYKRQDSWRCWHTSNTMCFGRQQGDFLQKFQECISCKVYRGSCPTVIEEIGEYINNIVHILEDQKQKMIDDKHHLDQMNEQLRSLMRQLEVKSRQIEKVMITDSLTKLFNRHHLITVLEDEIARCQRYGHPLAIMMIDIDNFRKINTTFGQEAGDRVLAESGRIIVENIRKFDRAFRYGGEEFVIVLPETDLTMAYIVAERIRKAFMNNSFKVRKKNSHGGEIYCTISIGLTATFTYSVRDVKIEDLISQTEEALLIAKDRGGNTSVRYGDVES